MCYPWLWRCIRSWNEWQVTGDPSRSEFAPWCDVKAILLLSYRLWSYYVRFHSGKLWLISPSYIRLPSFTNRISRGMHYTHRYWCYLVHGCGSNSPVSISPLLILVVWHHTAPVRTRTFFFFLLSLHIELFFSARRHPHYTQWPSWFFILERYKLCRHRLCETDKTKSYITYQV